MKHVSFKKSESIINGRSNKLRMRLTKFRFREVRRKKKKEKRKKHFLGGSKLQGSFWLLQTVKSLKFHEL